MTETDLMNSIRVALSEKGCTVFRCNVGKIKTADGRYFDTGLPVGYSDLFGFKPGGQVFFIETKMHPRKPTEEQSKFITAVKKKGALAGVAYSVEEALQIIEEDEYSRYLKLGYDDIYSFPEYMERIKNESINRR